MKKAHPEDYSDYAMMLQEDPDLLHPIFLLRNGWCNVYVDDRNKPSTLLVIDSTPDPDVYLIGKWNDWLVPRVEDAHPRRLFAMQGMLRRGSPFKDLTAAEAMLFWYDEPEEIEWEGQSQGIIDPDELEDFPGFLWKGYETADTLIDEGLATGVYDGAELACLANTYSMGEEYVNLAVYTRPEFRRKGYAEDALRSLMKFCMEDWDLRPVLMNFENDPAITALAKKIGFENQMPSDMDCLVRPDLKGEKF